MLADTNNNDNVDYQEQARRLYRGACLAPMVRASTTPLRALALHYGADFVYTEELVDRSISNTTRVENKDMGTIDYIKDSSKLSKKTRKKLEKEQRPCLIMRIDVKLEQGRIICQLGTGEPGLALAAAKHVYQDFAAIDINMGCPKKFSVSGGMGSALLDDPERAASIIQKLREEIPRPISCKIRLLKDTKATVQFIERMMQAGVNAVAIHARTVGHDATWAADWKSLKEVLAILRPKYPDFPFLVNGDFYDRQEYQDMLKETGANGVLLGRPALYNTSIFYKQPQPLKDKTEIIQEYLQRAFHYDIHFKNAKYVICEMMNNRRAPTERAPYLLQEYAGGQTIAKTCGCTNMKQMFQVWNVEWTTAQKMQEALAPGEHRYADSYFLKRQNDDTDTKGEQSDPKRLKIDTENGANAVEESETKAAIEQTVAVAKESTETEDEKKTEEPTRNSHYDVVIEN